MGDLVKTNKQQVATTAIDPFAAYATAVSPSNIVGTLLKFNKGDWIAGQHQDEVPEGTKFIAVMDLMTAGWVRWQDKRPTDQMMALVASGGAPRRADCGEMDKQVWPEKNEKGFPKDPWQQTSYIPLIDLRTGEVFTFATSSVTGIKSGGKLAAAYAKGRVQHKDAYPVVAIKTDSYMDDEYGKIKFPAFPIVEWAVGKKKYEDKLHGGDAVPAKEYEGVKSENPQDGFDDEIPF